MDVEVEVDDLRGTCNFKPTEEITDFTMGYREGSKRYKQLQEHLARIDLEDDENYKEIKKKIKELR